MTRKQYMKPLSDVCACNADSAMLAGSGSNTGTIPVGGGDGTKRWYSKRNDDFDELDEDNGSWE